MVLEFSHRRIYLCCLCGLEILTGSVVLLPALNNNFVVETLHRGIGQHCVCGADLQYAWSDCIKCIVFRCTSFFIITYHPPSLMFLLGFYMSHSARFILCWLRMLRGIGLHTMHVPDQAKEPDTSQEVVS